MKAIRNFYSKLDLAMELGICVRTLDSLMANGKISFSKIGARVIFSQRDLDEFVERNRKEAYAECDNLEGFIRNASEGLNKLNN